MIYVNFFCFVTQVSPKENLPQQICDLCIVQLNVSYNFKRLALKNDFYIRQYMIENGMNLLKDDDDPHNGMEVEIHQIHNVIRTNRFRPQPPPIPSIEPFRRNSTTSSVSGISTMLVNNELTNGHGATNGNAADPHFIHPSRPFVQPIQIKTEPVDPDYEAVENSTNQTTNQSSPSSTSSSGSILTVNSSEKSVRTTRRGKTPPMIVINGHVDNSPKASPSSKTVNEKQKQKEPARASTSHKDKENEVPTKKTKNLPTRATKPDKKTSDLPRINIRNLRTIRKPENLVGGKRKLREAAKKMVEKRIKKNKEEQIKKAKKFIKARINKAKQSVHTKNKNSSQRKPLKVEKRSRGRPVKK